MIMEKEEFKNKLEQVKNKINKPMVTAQFGDNWKGYAKDNFDLDRAIDIAYIQGRYALLLEKELENILCS